MRTRSLLKRGTIAFWAVALLIGTLVLGWQVFLPAYLESYLKDTLAEYGFSARALTVRSIGFNRTELADFEFTDGTTIDAITVEYRPAEISRNQRFDRLVITSLRHPLVDMPWAREGGDADAGAGETRPPVALPVDEVVLRDSRIAIMTPSGPIDLAFDLEAKGPAQGGITVAGAVTIHGESGEIQTPFSATISAAGAFEVLATPESGRLEWRGATLELRDGAFSASGTRAAVERADAMLAATITLPDGSVADLDGAGQVHDDALSVELTLAGNDVQERLELAGDLEDMSGPSPSLDARLAGDLRLLDRVAALAGLEPYGVMEGRLTARLSGELTPPAGGIPQSAGGSLDIVAHGILASGDRGGLSAGARFALAEGTLSVETERPALAEWRPPDSVHGYKLRLSARNGDAFAVRLNQVGTGWTVAAAGPYALSHGRNIAAGALDLTASLDETDGTLAGPIAADLEMSGTLARTAAIVGAQATLEGHLALADERWSLRPNGCIAIALESLTIAPATTTEGLSGCISALPDQPLLAMSPGRPDALTLAAIVDLEPGEVVLGSGTADPTRLGFELPEATVRVVQAEGRIMADVAAAGASLALPDQAIAFDGIDIAASADTTQVVPLSIRLDGATVRSEQTPPWFAPLSMTGFSAMARDGAFLFEGSVTGAGGAIAAAVNGQHDAASGAGRLDLRLDPVSFAEGVRQPADLAPVLGPVPITNVTGSIDGSARLAWGDRLTSSAELALEDVTLNLGAALVRSIDGRLRADSLIPFSLPDGQLLSVDGAEFGLVLEEGAMAFGVGPGGRLSVQGLGFGLAGGSLAVEPFDVGPADDELPMTVIMRGIDLARLAEQFPVEGLSLTGNIDGRIPLRLREDTITVENGVLESTEAGVIRYVASVPFGSEGEGGVALLINAVENFQYEALRATLNGRTGEDLDVAIRLTGANPEVYDGFPIALNVNLSGALDQILLTGLRSLAIADEAGRILRGE